MKLFRFVIIGACALLVPACCVPAAEPVPPPPPPGHREARPAMAEEQVREMARQLEKMRDKARELEAAGKREEAEEVRQRISALEREVRSAKAELPPPADMERREKQRREIEELKKQGRHEEAERLARRMEGDRPTRPGGGAQDPAGREELERRAQMVREAIGNLHAAGLHDFAENLERNVLPRMMHPERPFPPEGGGDRPMRRPGMGRERGQGMPGEPGAMRSDLERIGRMEAELRELRETLAKLSRRLEGRDERKP